jgi:hypothetical protein
VLKPAIRTKSRLGQTWIFENAHAPSAVGGEEREDLAGADVERDAVHGGEVAEFLTRF